MNVTCWVPSPKSAIFLGGVFVAQGSLDFSVTAASLATTLSLPVKVRLLIEQTALSRQQWFPGEQPKQCSLCSTKGRVPLVLYSEILKCFNSPVSGLSYPHGQTVWCTLSQHSCLTNNQSIWELFSHGGPQQQGTLDCWGSSIEELWNTGLLLQRVFGIKVWYLVKGAFCTSENLKLSFCPSWWFLTHFKIIW